MLRSFIKKNQREGVNMETILFSKTDKIKIVTFDKSRRFSLVITEKWQVASLQIVCISAILAPLVYRFSNKARNLSRFDGTERDIQL